MQGVRGNRAGRGRDRSEGQTLERLATPPDNEVQRVELLGKALPLLTGALAFLEEPRGPGKVSSRHHTVRSRGWDGEGPDREEPQCGLCGQGLLRAVMASVSSRRMISE